MLDSLDHEKAPGSIYDILVESEEAAYFAWNLVAVTPYAHVEKEMPTPKSRMTVPLTTLVAREGIKAPNKLCDVITAAYRHRPEIAAMKQSMCIKEPGAFQRDTVGMAIRKWDGQGGNWRIQVLYALLVDALQNLQSGSDAGKKPSRPCSRLHLMRLDIHAATDRTNFLSGWQTFLDQLADLNVMDAPSLKRLVDGRTLAKELGVRPGKWMGQALDVCVAWQFRHPDETDPAGAIEEVRQRSDELGIQ